MLGSIIRLFEKDLLGPLNFKGTSGWKKPKTQGFDQSLPGLSSLLPKAASTSSNKMIEFSGASARRCCSRSSDMPRSDKLRIQMEYSWKENLQQEG